MIPPAVVSISFSRNERKPIKLWLPVFVVWPIVFLFSVFLLFFLPLIVLVCISFGHAKTAVLLPFFIWNLICAVRGTIIDVDKANEKIRIRIW